MTLWRSATIECHELNSIQQRRFRDYGRNNVSHDGFILIAPQLGMRGFLSPPHSLRILAARGLPGGMMCRKIYTTKPRFLLGAN